VVILSSYYRSEPVQQLFQIIIIIISSFWMFFIYSVFFFMLFFSRKRISFFLMFFWIFLFFYFFFHRPFYSYNINWYKIFFPNTGPFNFLNLLYPHMILTNINFFKKRIKYHFLILPTWLIIFIVNQIHLIIKIGVLLINHSPYNFFYFFISHILIFMNLV